MNDIEQRITDVLATQLRVPRATIGPEVTFWSLNIDSLVLVELTLLLGDEFDVEIEEGVLRPEMTIAEAAGLIAARALVP